MTPLQSMFIQVINLSVAASFLMLAVILLRPLFKRVPKWLTCALWGMVALRLIVPFSFESRWSLVPAWKISVLHAEEVQAVNNGNQSGGSGAEGCQGESVTKNSSEDPNSEQVRNASTEKGWENPSEVNASQALSHDNDGENASHAEEIAAEGMTPKQNDQESIAITETYERAPESIQENETTPAMMVRQEDGQNEVTYVEAGTDENAAQTDKSDAATDEDIAVTGERMLRRTFDGVLLIVGSAVWLAGIIAMLAYVAISFVRLRSRLRTAVRFETGANVRTWMSDAITEPFVLGIVRPSIYVPSNIEEQDLECVLCHEQAHVKRGDYLWKPLGFLILCIYWFHPLCWISYFLFCRDVELACDEKATKNFGMEERKRYCQVLLNLGQGEKDSLIGTVAFGENGTKSRVEAVLKHKKAPFWVIVTALSACVLLGIFFMTSPNGKAVGNQTSVSTKNQGTDAEIAINSSEGSEMSSDWPQGDRQDPGKGTDESSDEASKRLSGKEAWEAEGIEVSNFYARDDGDIQNAYVIDEDGVLWGYGENRYGQLGQGFADQKFYKKRVKVAENAVHVDDSETGFVIYLTEEHKLYGLGNDGSGVMLTGGNMDWNRHVKGEEHAVCSPVLLMEHVQYACCGRNDVVCLLEDGSVWTWGITGISTARVYNYVPEPMKILDGAILVTGGLFNHAALLSDGSVWTWGYNYAGGCGVAEFGIVDTPTKVAENVIRVWTCQKRTNTCADYANMSPVNEKLKESTMIEKADHSFWSCGEGVGNKKRILKKYYEAVDFPMICTHEFLPCTPRNFDGTEATAEEAFKRFLAGDRTVLDPEQKKLGGFAGYLSELNFGFPFEYVLMDLDGDGTEELFVQGGDDLGDYNGVFHYENETGRVVSWRDDAFESDRVCLLMDGTMAKRWIDHPAGREYWTVFRYLSSGEEEELKRIVYADPSADRIEAGIDKHDAPWYEIDGVEVTKEESQKEYEESIYNKRVTLWRNAVTGEIRESGEGTGVPTWCFNTVHFEQKWLTKLEDFDRNGEEEYLTVEASEVLPGSGSILTVYWNKKAVYQYTNALNVIKVSDYQYVDLDGDGERELFLKLLPNVNGAGLVQYLVLKEEREGWRALENHETVGESVTNSFPLKITYSDKPWEAKITCDGYDGEIPVDVKRVYDAWEKEILEAYGDGYQKAFGKGNQSGECAQIADWGIWEIGLRRFEGENCLVARQGIVRDYKDALWGVVDVIFDYDRAGKIRVRDMRFEYVDEYYGALNLPLDAVMSDIKLYPGVCVEENGEGLLPSVKERLETKEYYYVKIDQPSSYSFKFRICVHDLLTDEDRAVTEWQRAYFYKDGSLAVSRFEGHELYFRFLRNQADSVPDGMTVDGLADFSVFSTDMFTYHTESSYHDGK